MSADLLGRFIYWLSLPAKENKPLWMELLPVLSIVCSAGVAIFVMLRSQWFTKRQSEEAYGLSILPSIIFVRRSERIWIIKNIGKGLAANLRIRNYLTDENVLNEMTLYPVVPNEEVRLDYLRTGGEKLIALYTNMFSEDSAHTICRKDTNHFLKGEHEDGLEPASTGHESLGEPWKVTRLSVPAKG